MDLFSYSSPICYIFIALKFMTSYSSLPPLLLTDAGEKQNDSSPLTSCRLHVRSSTSSSSPSNPLWSRRETKNESGLSGLGEGRLRSGLAPSLCRHSNTLRTIISVLGSPECDYFFCWHFVIIKSECCKHSFKIMRYWLRGKCLVL